MRENDSDLRTVREQMAHRVVECFLCFPAHRPIIAQNELAIALYDAHPVTSLHALIVPRRHAAGRGRDASYLAPPAQIRT